MILVEAIKQVDHSFLEISAQTDRSKWQVDSEGDTSYSYDVIMILVEAIKQVDHTFLKISAQMDRSKWQVDSEGDP
ncbi:unnamed protein product [Rotaria magnacalcarata]